MPSHRSALAPKKVRLPLRQGTAAGGKQSSSKLWVLFWLSGGSKVRNRITEEGSRGLTAVSLADPGFLMAVWAGSEWQIGDFSAGFW